MKIGGLVLAGGLSSRFGSEKAVAGHKGRTMMAWPVDLLRLSCAEVAVSVKPGDAAEALAAEWGLERLFDAPGDPLGPLSGVKAGLAWAEGRGFDLVAVAPCDTPELPSDLIAQLAEALDDAGAAYAVTEQGPQPLCSLWRVSALPVLADLLQDGHPPVRVALARLNAAAVLFEDAAAFRNFNTPED